MIARSTPYALTPFQPELELLIARVSAASAAPEELMLAAGEMRRLFEGIAAGSAPDRTPADEWTCRYDGERLTAAGPRVLVLASLDAGVLRSLAIDFPAGSFEWTAEGDAARVHLTDTAGASRARLIFGADGSITDENAPPPAAAAFDGLFGAPVAEPEPEPAAQPEKQWYYVAEGKPEGPLPESELCARLVSLPPATLVWNEEMPEWRSAQEVGLGAAEPAAPEPVSAPAAVESAAPAQEPEPPQEWELAVQGLSAAGPWRVSEEMRIGRSPECDIPLTDGMASRVHAFVRRKPDGVWLEDNHSLNGTEVNGARVGDPVCLVSGDVIRIGGTELVVRAVEQQPAVQAAAAPAGFDPPPASCPEPAPEPDPFAALFAEPAPQAAQPAEPASDARFCSDCGGKNRSDAVFCIHCGQRLGK